MTIDGIHYIDDMNTRVILSDNNVVSFFDKQRQVYVPSSEELQKIEAQTKALRVGNLYSLRGAECDGFTMPKKVYEVIAIVNEVNGCDLDSVVMKQVDGDASTIFSLTKNDCKTLGIEFQNGLQLFPKGLDWHSEMTTEEPKVEKEVEYNPMDLSTYPCDFHTRTIRRMCCKLYGFREHRDMITTPYGDMSLSDFATSLKVKAKTSWEGWSNGYLFPFNIITYDYTNQRFRIADNVKSSVYLEINLETHVMPRGIDPYFFKDKSFSDLFEITWCQSRQQVSPFHRVNPRSNGIVRYNVENDAIEFYKDNGVWEKVTSIPSRTFIG